MTISIADLQHQLRSKYNVKIMHDLGKVSGSPGELLKLLQSVCQDSYEPNDRLVFYTSHLLTEKFLKHLYETVNFIDISNCFVLICGPKELENKIQLARIKFSNDLDPFCFRPVDLIETTHKIEDNFYLPDTICAIPWTNLQIMQNGDITPCCMNNLVLGNIENVKLEQAFRTDKLQQLRNSLLSGEKPKSCDICWKVEEKNLTSIRMHNIKRLKKDFLTTYLDQPQVTTLDIKFNNTCNFKCRICNGESSSLFALEDYKFRGITPIVQNNWGESPDFIDQVSAHLPNIQNIDMYGGEPFLIKKFKSVLEFAANKGYAKNIRLHYNSNGSIWPEHLLSVWPSFKQVDIHFSIDAVGAQFELQRGGQWSEVENNILKIRDLGLPNLTISLMPTISVMNIYYIDQVYDWAVKHGFPIFVSHVQGESIDLRNLTCQSKKIIIDKYKDHPWREMQNLINIIQELPDSDGKKFQSKMQWFDQIRGEKFSNSHPEIAKAMGYV
jgi:radical SAM protein with 4Fe4S-binding SPASM domain